MIAFMPANVQCVSRTLALLPTDMAEVVGIISGVVRQTKGFAQGLTLLLRGATSWLFLWLRESPLVSLERISIVLRHCCLVLRISMGQLIEVCGNARQDTHHTGVIKPGKLGLIIRIGTQIDHDHLSTLQLLKPADAPP